MPEDSVVQAKGEQVVKIKTVTDVPEKPKRGDVYETLGRTASGNQKEQQNP